MERSIASVLALAALLAVPAASSAQVTRAVPPQTVRMAHADLATLRDVQEQGRKHVVEIAARLATTPPGPQRVALQRQVEAAKLEARLTYLAALANWAQAHGQTALAAQAEEVARRLTELAQPALPGTDMPREKVRAPKEVRP